MVGRLSWRGDLALEEETIVENYQQWLPHMAKFFYFLLQQCQDLKVKTFSLLPIGSHQICKYNDSSLIAFETHINPIYAMTSRLLPNLQQNVVSRSGVGIRAGTNGSGHV